MFLNARHGQQHRAPVPQIRARGNVSLRDLLADLEVSPAMFQRDLKFLRSRLGAPVEYDPGLNGYRFGAAHAGFKHELPGLWFDESELYSLLMAQQRWPAWTRAVCWHGICGLWWQYESLG